MPERICFGDPFGPSALYLKFPSGWNARGRAVKAFLTLTPSDAAASDASTISVTAWRVRSDWQPGELRTWSDKPELAPPFASRAITSAPPRELRIDVTELARFAAENPERDFGIALVSRGGAGRGAPFATGMAGGVAPRLEVYVH
ncbi:MAG: DNRLRE domain-containing protein [Myxococcales bacterium]